VYNYKSSPVLLQRTKTIHHPLSLLFLLLLCFILSSFFNTALAKTSDDKHSDHSGHKQHKQHKTLKSPKAKTPKSTINQNQPAYQWQAAKSADGYEFIILLKNKDILFTASLSAEQAGCADSSRLCSYTPDVVLDEGKYKWRVRAMNTDGYSKWSNFRTFKVKDAGDVVVIDNQPTANAGEDQQVVETREFTLQGSGTIADGSIVAYHWAQTGGASIGFSAADTATITVGTPEVTTDELLTFTLTVTDDQGNEATDSVDVLIENLQIDDPDLFACISTAPDSGSMTSQDLLSLTFLDCSNGAVSDDTDLSELEKLPELKTLFLADNQLTGVSALANLTSLTFLALDANAITDMTALSNLSALQYLLLSNNRITELPDLNNMAALIYLELSDNRVANIAPQTSPSPLLNLYLDNNRITDVTPLSSITLLQDLALESNLITDINPLSSLSNLMQLHVTGNCITDFSLFDASVFVGSNAQNPAEECAATE
jgi:internalin A